MENKVKVWIARDKDGGLFAFPSIPLKKANIWSPGLGINMMQLKSGKFPSVKWEDDEPTEAYITLAEPQEHPKQEQPTPKQEIDWEQRRYEIAKSILSAMFSQPEYYIYTYESTVDSAVKVADILIEKLKKEGEK